MGIKGGEKSFHFVYKNVWRSKIFIKGIPAKIVNASGYNYIYQQLIDRKPLEYNPS